MKEQRSHPQIGQIRQIIKSTAEKQFSSISDYPTRKDNGAIR